MINAIRKKIGVRILAGVIAILIIFASIIGWIGYREFTDLLLEQYADGAFRTADSAALTVNPDHIDRFVESGGKSSEYLASYFSMDQLCNSQDVTFIYVIRPDLTDYGHITFIISTINKNSPYGVYEFGFYRKTTNDEYREKYRALYEGTSERELVIRDKGYIQTDPHITAMIPLKGADHKTKAILCVQRQMDTLVTFRQQFIRKIVLALLVAAAVVILAQGGYLYRLVIQPLVKIKDEAERFADENVIAPVKLTETIRNQDEIGVLADSIDRMEEQIQDYVANLTRVTAEKERIGAELDVASKIQAGALPSLFPPFPDRGEFDLYAAMLPAREVGGDFYDFFMVDDDHLCLVIADVSGKSIPGALFMMVSKILISMAVQNGNQPGAALTRVNKQLCRNNRAEMFVTVWLGILELSTGMLRAANAGHEYPAICRRDGHYELFKDSHGLVLGGMEDMCYKDYEIQLEHGDRLFVYTDGVTEATDSDNELFGKDRMLDSLNHSRTATAAETLEIVRKDINGFVKDAPQFDDITMLCLLYK